MSLPPIISLSAKPWNASALFVIAVICSRKESNSPTGLVESRMRGQLARPVWTKAVFVGQGHLCA